MKQITRNRFTYDALDAVARGEWTCALRAPTGFSVRIKNIRTENPDMEKNKDSAGVLYKIIDRARTAFRPCAIGDPRGRFFVRAK